MVRKCRRIAEIAVVEVATVGVKTRARAALSMATGSSGTTVKRRKIDCEKEQLKLSPPSSIAEIRSRGDLLEREERNSSPNSDHSPASCCSSNRSGELDEDRIKFIDLEAQSVEAETSTYNCSRERREMTPSSDLGTKSEEMLPTSRPAVAISRRVLTEKMPSELEIEEFFASSEKDIQKRFVQKYNYDIVKDVPLEGRYEWVRLKP